VCVCLRCGGRSGFNHPTHPLITPTNRPAPPRSRRACGSLKAGPWPATAARPRARPTRPSTTRAGRGRRRRSRPRPSRTTPTLTWRKLPPRRWGVGCIQYCLHITLVASIPPPKPTGTEPKPTRNRTETEPKPKQKKKDKEANGAAEASGKKDKKKKRDAEEEEPSAKKAKKEKKEKKVRGFRAWLCVWGQGGCSALWVGLQRPTWMGRGSIPSGSLSWSDAILFPPPPPRHSNARRRRRRRRRRPTAATQTRLFFSAACTLYLSPPLPPLSPLPRVYIWLLLYSGRSVLRPLVFVLPLPSQIPRWVGWWVAACHRHVCRHVRCVVLPPPRRRGPVLEKNTM
jgi:hypothetical protein